ncbi:MAG: hypothetical protein EBS96_12710 [Spartobacteria bacterium]|nr:hypothetical protein [Spartobacteria bacterium]
MNGTFSYTPVSGTVLGAGNQTLSTVFTPTDAANYNTANKSVTLAVTKSNQTISGLTAALSKVVGAAPYSLNASVTSNLTLSYVSSNTSVATVAANGTVTVVGAGTAIITVSQAGNANYNAATNVTQTLTVSKAPPVINLTGPSSLTYDGSSKMFTATGNGVASFIYAYAGRNTTVYANSATPPSLAGDYKVVATSNATATLEAGSASVNYTITPKPVTLSFSALTKSYDGTTSISAIATLVGAVSGDDVSAGGTPSIVFGNATVGVGKPITASGYALAGTKAPNYSLTQPVGLTGTITPKAVTLTANSTTKLFGTTLTGGSVSNGFRVSGMVAPDAITSVTITYGNASASTAPVGIYAGQVTPSVAVGSFAAASTGYNVESSNSMNMTASTLLTTGNVTSLSINSSASNVQFFRVRSLSAAGNGTWSPVQVVQTVKVPPTKTSNIALAADPGVGNLTISGIFGASNEAGLTASLTAGNATQILLMTSNGTAGLPIFFKSDVKLWTQGANTTMGTTPVPKGTGFQVKNPSATVTQYLILSGSPWVNTGNVTIVPNGAGKNSLLGTLRSSPTLLTGMNLVPGAPIGIKGSTTQATADQVVIDDGFNAASTYWFHTTQNVWYSSNASQTSIATPFQVPAGAGIIIKQTTGSTFTSWSVPGN